MKENKEPYDNYNNPEQEQEEEQKGGKDGESTEPYQVEQIANILAVTCIFLSALYTIFAVLLFLCHAGEEQSIFSIEQGSGVGRHLNSIPNHGRGQLSTVELSSSKTTPLVVSSVVGNTVGHQHQTSSTLVNSTPGFITMENSSQGTTE